VVCDVPISFAQASLGAEIDIPSLDGKIKYAIPEGTQTATVFKLKGKGIKHIRSNNRGDEYIRVNVEIPVKMSQKQKDLLRQFAQQRGYEVVCEYTDVGVSGTKARRPGLDAMLKDARRRKFNVVLVAAFDRMARSVKHFLLVVDELDSLGIEFVSRRENIDTSGAMGRLFLTLIGAISELERSLIVERIRAGMRRRRLEGLPLGRQPLDVDHEALVADRLAGMSLTNVAKKYGVSRASVVRFVREAQRAELGDTSGLGNGQPRESASVCVS
jgi:DNA invertase Pin-like site-specific DNA recombinase